MDETDTELLPNPTYTVILMFFALLSALKRALAASLPSLEASSRY